MVGWMSQSIARQCHGIGYGDKATDGWGFTKVEGVRLTCTRRAAVPDALVKFLGTGSIGSERH
ncbi:hypothetical protein Ct61P_11464 [Colletotrichum tofieldiae]|nr:hypothetical protein Ct61P_11464 [Colletotrichum tofieldiae]